MFWIDCARVFAILAVIILHVSGSFVSHSTLGSENWWIGNIVDSAVRWCVPVLVMISGALLLDTERHERITFFYRRRLSKILIPLVFWSFFSLFFINFSDPANAISVGEMPWRVASGNTYYHLWYLYMIVGMYIFTPLMRATVRNMSHNDLLVAASTLLCVVAINAIWLVFYPGLGRGVFVTWFLQYVPYFFTGYLIRRQERIPKKTLCAIVFLISVGMTAYGVYFVSIIHGLGVGQYFYDYVSLTVIPMSISVMYFFKNLSAGALYSSRIRYFASLSFGVYLVHAFYLQLLVSSGYGPERLHPLASIPIITIVITVASILTAGLIRRVPILRAVI